MMSLLIGSLCCIGAIGIAIVVWMMLHFFFPLPVEFKLLGCKYMGWHNGRGTSSKGSAFDGCSIHAQCSWCGKDVMQDSQGNWF